MSELENEYGDRVDFTLVPSEQTLASKELMLSYGFETFLHGLVGFDAQGEIVTTLEGHMFTPADYAAVMERMLAED